MGTRFSSVGGFRVAWVFFVALLAGCGRDEPPPLPKPASKAQGGLVQDTDRFRPQAIGYPVEGIPWIAHVKAVDLDGDGLLDILVCDCRKNEITWVRQAARGQFEEIALATEIPAPVHVEAVDMNGDGHLDLLVSSMGEVFPNNDRIGSIIILENDGHQHFTKHVIADHIARVTDIQAGDFDHDGKLDLAVGQFGYDQGEVQWMRNLGDWKFEGHTLLNLSGTINVCVADFNGHGALDIAAVVSQQWEEVHLFTNNGTGKFTDKVIFGSTNEDFASSGLRICDLNHDGRPDLLYTNGDGFGPSPTPGPRPWHGVQWLENRGDGNFQYHRIGYLPGAYSAVGVDVDGDGNTDIVALSGFNDWGKPDAVSMVWFRNDGQQHFTQYALAYQPTHLITVDAGDFDGTGKPSLVTGAFHAYPPFQNYSRLTFWRPTK